MAIQEISCKSFKLNTFKRAKKFNFATESMESLYHGELGKFDIGKIKKINIVLHDKLLEQSKLPSESLAELSKEERKQRMTNRLYYYQNQVENQIDVVSIHRLFDFDNWEHTDKSNKKRIIINEIHASMQIIATHFNCSDKQLQEAFESCKKSNFENKWLINKLKVKSSPNRKFKAGVFAEYDLEEFRFYAMIYDTNDNLLNKTLMHIEIGDSFSLKAQNIIEGKTKWNGNNFCLFDKIGKLVFELDVTKNAIPEKLRYDSLAA